MSDPSPSRHVRVAIVGAGFAGVGAAARLRADGVDQIVIFERADAVGGVWRDNVYPGAACDVESHLYHLADAPNADWTRRFAQQPEIRDYLERVVADRDLGRHLHLGTTVEQAVWDDGSARWHLATDGDAWTADVMVVAVGALAEPRFPAIPGLDSFSGPVMHTARWDGSLELGDARVAVIGTGASAIQIVPALQPQVRHLAVFMRTAPTVVPRRDAPLSERTRRRLGRWPSLRRGLRQALYVAHEVQGLPFRKPSLAPVGDRIARRHRDAQIADPALRERLTPDYRFGCKRILLSDDFYPALQQPNVTLAGAATEIRADAVVAEPAPAEAGETAHPADVLVFATGFHVHDFPFIDRVVGRPGRLSEVWQGEPTAFAGTTVAGFPNLFMMQGPNTGLGHSSVLLMMEAQIEHLVGAVRAMDEYGLAAVEPRPQAQAAFVAEVDRMSEGTAWTSGCDSWYLGASGRNAAVWPGSVGAFRRRVETFDPSDYVCRTASPTEAAQPVAP